MNGLRVAAPLAGTVVALEAVPDLVFAQGMVGPGVAIDPAPGEEVTVVSPVAGTIAALHPHAFAVAAAGGDILVHLGIDTVTLGGDPFEVLVEADAQVAQGEAIVRWRLGEIGALSPLVPVVALGKRDVHHLVKAGGHIGVGNGLFHLIA